MKRAAKGNMHYGCEGREIGWRENEMRRYPSGSFKSLSQIQHEIVLARERNVARDLL